MDAMSLCLLAVAAGSSGCGAYVALGGGAAWMRRARREILARAGTRLRLPSLSDVGGREDKRRRADVAREMPTFLDIVTLGLAAGLSFDASVELYCTRFETALSSALWDAMLLWRMGVRTRADALQELADAFELPAMTRFAQTVSEALAFGTPLAQTLERQAQVIRDEQRSLVEEEIERVPVKMLIPLGTLIVPAMLLAILGPLLGPAVGMA